MSNGFAMSLQHPNVSRYILRSAVEFESYRFNFTGDPSKDLWGEVNYIEDFVLKISKVDHFLNYEICLVKEALRNACECSVEDDIIILLLSTTNSAHSISELFSFVSFYKSNNLEIAVGISSHIRDYLPLLFEMLYLFIPRERIFVINSQGLCKFRRAILRRNTHMNYIKDWNKIPYESDGSILKFKNIQYIGQNLIDDIPFVQEIAKRVQISAKNSAGSDHIMLLKRSTDANMTTPGRAVAVSERVASLIEEAGIRLISIDQFNNVEDYIATIYNAKTFIVSYGGAACTNRFFCNPKCHVILLANKAYKWEYDYPNENGDFWHLRHSHLYPVARQDVILDHNDVFTVEDVRLISSLMKSNS